MIRNVEGFHARGLFPRHLVSVYLSELTCGTNQTILLPTSSRSVPAYFGYLYAPYLFFFLLVNTCNLNFGSYLARNKSQELFPLPRVGHREEVLVPERASCA